MPSPTDAAVKAALQHCPDVPYLAMRDALEAAEAAAPTQQSVPQHSGVPELDEQLAEERVRYQVLREIVDDAIPVIDSFFKYLAESGLSEEGGGLALHEASKPLADIRARLAEATQQSVSNQFSEHSGVEKAVEELAKLLWNFDRTAAADATITERRAEEIAEKWVAAIQPFLTQPTLQQFLSRLISDEAVKAAAKTLYPDESSWVALTKRGILNEVERALEAAGEEVLDAALTQPASPQQQLSDEDREPLGRIARAIEEHAPELLSEARELRKLASQSSVEGEAERIGELEKALRDVRFHTGWGEAKDGTILEIRETVDRALDSSQPQQQSEKQQ